MKIELVGLPGSGKTTLSKKLYEYTNNSSYLLSSKSDFVTEKDFENFKNLFNVDNKIAKILKFIPPKLNKYVINYYKKKESVSSFAEMFSKWGSFIDYFIINIDKSPNLYNKSCKEVFIDFILHYFIFHQNENMKNKNLIIDSGIIFKSTYLSNYFNEDNKKISYKLTEYEKNCPFLPDKIFYLKIDPQTSLKRITKRKNNFPIFLKNYSEEEMIKKLMDRSIVLENLIEIIKKKGVKVIKFDANIPKSEIYKKILIYT